MVKIGGSAADALTFRGYLQQQAPGALCMAIVNTSSEVGHRTIRFRGNAFFPTPRNVLGTSNAGQRSVRLYDHRIKGEAPGGPQASLQFSEIIYGILIKHIGSKRPLDMCRPADQIHLHCSDKLLTSNFFLSLDLYQIQKVGRLFVL